MTFYEEQPVGRASASSRQAISRGVSWTAFGVVAGKGVSLLGKLILAALLVPEHFGMVSMILVFTQFVKTGADLGVREALVQRKRDRTTRLLYDSAFWLLLAVGVGLVVAMWVVGVPLLVWFYGAPELSSIAIVMSLGIVIQNLHVVPEAILARVVGFKAIILSEFVGAITGAVVAVALAFQGAGAWSLVAQILIGSLCTAAALFFSARWLPRLRFAAPPLREMKQYSSYILGSRALVYLQQNLDYLLLGKLMGAYSLGIYSLAFLLTETLRSHIYWVVSRVVYPVYCRILGDAAQIRTIYYGTVRYMTLAMFPASMMLILYADEAIPLLFKDVWRDAVEPVKILALASLVTASAGTPGQVLKAVGRADVDFSVNLRVTLLAAFPALWIGIVLLGVEGAAWAVVLHCSISRTMFHVALRRAIGVKLLDILIACWPAIAGSLLMLLCSLLLTDLHWLIAAATSCAAYSLAAVPVAYDYFFADPARRRRSSGGDCKIIAILGPDGAGKTTLAQQIESRASGLGRRLYLGMGTGESWRLPFVRIFYEFHLGQTVWAFRMMTGALLWYVLFPIELVARRAAIRSTQRGTFLVLDRLPGQPFLKGGLLLLLYRLLLPKPDVIVLLNGDPAEIAGRKPAETSAERTASEMAKWEAVAQRIPAGSIVRLDTTRNTMTACTEFLMRTLTGSQLGEPALRGIEGKYAA